MKPWSILCCFVCLACVPEKSEYINGWVPADETKCGNEGGTLVFGRAGPTCAMPSKDAGKSCFTGSDCEAGLCLQKGRQCAPLDQNFGCIDILEDGQPVTLCID